MRTPSLHNCKKPSSDSTESTCDTDSQILDCVKLLS